MSTELSQAQIDKSYEHHCVAGNPYAPSRKYWGRAMQSGYDLALASQSAAPAGEPPKPVAWMRTQRTNSADWDYIDFSANPEPGFDVPLYAAASPLPAEPAGVQGVHQTERLADGAAVGESRKLTKKQRRMADAVAWYQKYVAAHSEQSSYLDYRDETFIDDMVYGIGVAMDKDAHSFAGGFDTWLAKLRKRIDAKLGSDDAAMLEKP